MAGRQGSVNVKMLMVLIVLVSIAYGTMILFNLYLFL